MDIGLARTLVLSLMGLTPVALLGQTAKPNVAAVANVASYSLGPVSAGEMVVIFGTAMGPSSLVPLQLDANGKVANTLAGVQVLFDGVAAPLIYVWEGQIAAMVPYGVAGNLTTQIQVVYGGVASNAFQTAIAPSAPGIFTADASGKGQAAMTNSDSQYNTSTHPAAPGEWVTLYLTGEGRIDPPGSDGTIAATTTQIVLPVVVRIAGQVAQLLYAGSAPGNVNGFAQVNAVVPPGLQYGGDLPLTVQVGNATSQTDVTVAVSGPPAPRPGTPLSLSAIPNSASQIVLTWTPADTLATSFHVERTIGTGPFTEIANVPANSPTFPDGNVTPGTAYQYRVRAENDWGFSAYSSVATATVIAPQLLPPSNVQATAINQNQVTLTWNGANTNAVQFQIERKAGSDAAFTLVATVPSSQTTYQDSGLVPNITYVYRMRSQGKGEFSGYSNEVTVTTPAAPPPPAPVLQATAMSSSQVHLSWTTTATGILLFSVERRITTGAYSQISQPTATSTSFDDSGLIGSTTYLYRMRVQTAAGFSLYSNEVTVKTLQALPAAPTSLQARTVSSSQINLTWTNNAPDAIAIRVEFQVAGSTTFTDIGAASTLTSAAITNLQPNTAYNFRVRAQNAVGYSGYSNVAAATTLPIPKTVFLVHGLNQGPADMQNLAVNLASSSGLSASRFKNIDYGFDFSGCADATLAFCSVNCTIPGGAQRLAQYIVNANPPGDIVLIGFSLGGLIARDLIVNNRITLNGRQIHLVTIGTPNLGYPYLFIDNSVFCSAIVSAMYGDWRVMPNTVDLSDYLSNLTNQSSSSGFPGTGRAWFAASGRGCSIPTRLGEGCRDQNPYSDGVVCQDSAAYNVGAAYNLSTAAGTQPNYSWKDPNGAYVHSYSGFTSLILCDTSDQTRYLPLWNPPVTGSLFISLTAILNGL